MTKEEALRLIEQVISVYKGTRQEHLVLQEALEKIKSLVEPKKN